MRLTLAAVLFGGASALEALKSRPVSEVIKLLEGMEKQLAEEAVADEKSYTKMQCWCKETKRDAANSVEENSACMDREQARAEEASGNAAKLTQEVANLEKNIKDNTQQLEEGTAMRKKELNSFSGEEKELVAAISGLKSAVTVLSKHNSLLQTGYGSHMANIAATISTSLDRFVSLHAEKITPAQKGQLEQFIQQPTFAAYQSQSGEIFGILQNMLDEFSKDLDESRKGESEAVKNFANLKKTKEKMIKGDKKNLDKKKVQKGEAVAAGADAKAKAEECKASRSQEETRLADANESCANSDTEYEERVKARAEEQGAVQEALKFLDSDEAHELFGKALGFVQIQSSNKQQSAAEMLRKSGMRLSSPDILVLAQKVKKGVFTDVIRAIDNLVKEIKNTMSEDVKTKDQCNKDINDQKKALTALENEIANNQNKETSLNERIGQLTADLERTAEEIAEAQKLLKEAGADREEENSNFQVAVKDQQSSIAVLKQALQVLAKVYGAKFLQVQDKPAGFKQMNKSAGGNKVLQMIETIIGDTEKSVAVAIQSENDSQKAYEKMVRDTNESIDKKRELEDSLNIEKADAEEELQQTVETLERQANEHEVSTTTHEQTKSSCKFLLNNFDLRQDHMTSEIEALGQAKAFLQNMK